MALTDDILSESCGARFRRADLHIHSYGDGGSTDNHDTAMTPQGIVDTAIAEKLDVIAITDHNNIGNVRPAIEYAAGRVLLVPGVELSTPQGHLLVYTPTWEALQAFVGKLDISADRSTCSNTIPQCLEYAQKYDGIGICAHIDLPNGFDQSVPKNNAFKHDIFKLANLLALEITKVDCESRFTNHDDDPDRKTLSNIRRQTLHQEDGCELAKVMSSDAHSLGALGRNANGNRRLTRLKMETLTFDALRIALLDPIARTRLEDLLPESIPHFIGMRLEGGFLDGQVVHFSRNLTCIIGGRGAGKSTLLESLRVCSGNRVTNTLVDCDIWPNSISLVYRDEVGQEHVLERNKLCTVTNKTDPDDGPTRVQIESYGQGETAATIQHCDEDPEVLLTFLDEFADLYAFQDRDKALRDLLLQNQTAIERLDLELAQIPNAEQAKKLADKQVEALKQQKAKDIVALEEKLLKERTFRQQLIESLNGIVTSVRECLSSESLKEIVANFDGTGLVVGKQEFAEVQKLVASFATKIDDTAKDVTTKTDSFVEAIRTQLKQWKDKEAGIQSKIEDIRRDLERQNVRLDMAFIRKVTKDATDFGTKLAELTKKRPVRAEAAKQRRAFLKERRELRSRIFTTRTAFATKMNKNLAETVVDYSVSIKFLEGRLSQQLEDIIKSAMEWRTSQVPRARLIASQLSPIDVLDAIEKRDNVPFRNVKDEDGSPVFSQTEAGEILATLGPPKVRYAIERCEFDDRPEIRVTKAVDKPEGGKSYLQKDFSQLSLGQQQSILLSIMLFSTSKVPLIIDQPEDNLDSEFIYKTVVRTLRRVKECRQVIVVTHNANIAVLGDAELIVPLRGSADRAVIRARGSIDNAATKRIVCTILEGSEDAFRKRAAVYGLQ